MTAGWTGPVLVTGTDTGVGKTVVTAAVAAAATRRGLDVAVVKPCEAGTAAGEETDADVVTRLAAPRTVRTLVSYPDPLAPLTAARVSGLPAAGLDATVDAIRATPGDLVLIEGAGGLLVRLGSDPRHGDWTAADLAVELGARAVLVARAGLGTLNHTALTLEAFERRGIPATVVIGAWPAHPELVHRTNLDDLRELSGELSGVLPDAAGGLPAAQFRAAAPGWLTPTLHGTLALTW